MKSFQTTISGKTITWELGFKFATLRNLKAATGLNLTNPIEARSETDKTTSFERLYNGLDLFADVLFAICKAQADGLGVSEDQFIEALDDKALADSRTAFFEAWQDYLNNAGLSAAAVSIQRQIEAYKMIGQKILEIPVEAFMNDANEGLQQLFSGNPA